MNLIDLSPIPNQSLSFQLDQHYYDLRVKLSGNQMLASISRDNVVLVQNQRIIINWPILLYKYQTVGENFILTSVDEELPDYKAFGNTQFLYYVNESDAT